MRNVMAGISVLFLTAFPAAHATEWTDLLEYAERENPDVQSAVYQHGIAVQDSIQARAARLPSVSLSAATGPEEIRVAPQQLMEASASAVNHSQVLLNIHQPIYAGGSLAHEHERSVIAESSAALRVLDAREGMAWFVVESAVQAQLAKSLMNLDETLIREHEDIELRVAARVANGVAHGVDLEQSRERLAMAQQTRAVREFEYRKAMHRLSRLSGISSPELPATLPDCTHVIDEAASAVITLQETAAWKSAALDVDAANAAAKARRGVMLPRLAVEVSSAYDRNEGDGNDVEVQTHWLALRMSYDVFKGGGDKARYREAVIRRDLAREQEIRLQREIEEQYRNSIEQWRAADANLPLVRRQRNAQEYVVDAYEAQYEAGRRSLLDVLNARDARYRARVAEKQAMAERALAACRVAVTLDKLIPALSGQGTGDASNE